MKIEFEIEESREIFVFLTDRVLKEAGLSEKDRAVVRKWRSDSMRASSDGMRDLQEKMNADLARALETKKRSAVRKPDWR